MTKEQLSNCLNGLNQVYDAYYLANESLKKGKNKGVRDNATNNMDIAKSVVKNLFDSHPELWDYVEYPDEFFSYQYFLDDLRKLISTLKSKQSNQQ